MARKILFGFVLMVFLLLSTVSVLGVDTVAYWKFDNVLTDDGSLGGGYDLVKTGGDFGYNDSILNQGVNESTGASFIQNDSNDHSYTGTKGVDFWLYMNNLAPGISYIMNMGDRGVGVAPVNDFLIRIHSDGKFQAWFNGGADLVEEAASISANTWYHIVVHWNETNFCYYKDSVLKNCDNAFTDTSDVFDNMVIGNRLSGGETNAAPLIDNLAFINETWDRDDVVASYNGGAGLDFSASAGLTNLNLSDPLPPNEQQFNTQELSINLTANSTYTFNCSLYYNGTLNETKTDFNAGTEIPVNFTLLFSADTEINFSYYVSCESEGLVNTSQNNIYIDNVGPSVVTNFTIGTIVAKENLSAQFNFSDDFQLFSYNLTTDVSIASQGELNATFYVYNLSYNASSLALGQQELQLRLTDGHTAKWIPDYEVRDGLFNNYINFDNGRNNVNIELKDQSVFDSWSATRLVDRYTFEVEPNDKGLTSYTFVVETDEDIIINNDGGKYKNYLISGTNWIDFVMPDQPQSTVNIKRLSSKMVEVTVGNLVNPQILSFNSIGELNIIERNYTFYRTAVDHISDATVIEKDSQTFILNINTTDGISSTSASFNYNGTAYSTTKTSYGNYDSYVTTLTTPEVEGVDSANVTYNWSYVITGVNSSEIGEVVDDQDVFNMGIDNCSDYTMRAFDISLQDDDTLEFLNGTIDAYFETWTDTRSDFISHNVSWAYRTENNPVGLCIFPNSSVYVSYSQWEYTAPGYDSKTYYFWNQSLTNVSQNLTFYLTNGSSLVTFTVIDEFNNYVEDVLIKILKYDVGTSTSKLTEIVKTDSNGQAVGQIVLNTQEYKFVLERYGSILLEEDEVKLTSTSKQFQVNLGANLFERQNINDNMFFSLNYNNDTLGFTFTFNDGTGKIDQGCLRVRRMSINTVEEIGDTCNATTSATIITNLTAPVGTSTYVATGYIIYDGYKQILDELTISYDERYKKFGLEGIFATLMITITLVMVALWSPMAAIILMIIAVSFSVILGIFGLDWPILLAFIIIGGLTLYRLKNR